LAAIVRLVRPLAGQAARDPKSKKATEYLQIPSQPQTATMADLPGFAAPEAVKTPGPEHVEDLIDIDIDIDDKMEVETPQKDDNSDDDDDDDDQVQVISPQQAAREARRKRRRRLYKMLNKPGAIPSFLALLTRNEEQLEEDSDDESIPPPVVVIDVDAYLGLKRVFPDGAFSGYDMNMSPVHYRMKRYRR
jgi:hypothetical protein